MARALGVTRASLLLHGFDPELHFPRQLSPEEVQRYGCDASFIGTWSPKKEKFLTHLVRGRPNLKLRVWGAQWERVSRRAPLRPFIMNRTVEGVEYAKAICASRVNIALLSERRNGSSGDDQITSRTFHIPACGGFMLHERTDEVLEKFDADRHIGVFESPEDLVQETDRYLSDASTRETYAAAARALVLGRDSWDVRVASIVEKHQALTGHK
jgi:hypothetical protein